MIRPLSKVRLMPFSTGASPNDLVMFFSSSMVRYYLPRTGEGCLSVRHMGAGPFAGWVRCSVMGPDGIRP